MSSIEEESPRKCEGAVLAARPVTGDAQTGKLLIRHIITFGPACLFFYVQFRTTGDWVYTIWTTLVLAAFAGIAFGYDFFGWHLKGLGRWRRDAPDLARQEYFTWAGHSDILGIRSSNGRRLTLTKAFKVAVLPTTIHGNFKQFCKQLASSRVPFTFQVVHVPALPQSPEQSNPLPAGSRPRDWRAFEAVQIPGWEPKSAKEGAWETSIIYATHVTARGYLLVKPNIRKLRRQLDAQAMSLHGAFVSNYPHSKLLSLEGTELVKTCQGLFPGAVVTSPKRICPLLRPADVVKIPIIASWVYLAANFFALFDLAMLGILCNIIVISLAVLGSVPTLWPIATGGDQMAYYDPFAGQHFYLQRRRGRTARGVACIRDASRVASFAGMAVFGHLSLEGYADPNKWLRQVMASQIPILYQWDAAPLAFDEFYALSKHCFASDDTRAAARAEPEPAQETFLAHWGGWWHAAGLVGTRADIPLANLRDAKEWHAGRKAATKQLRALGQMTINAYRDCGLYRLRAQDMRAGLAVMAGRAISAWESGTAFCKFVIAGSTYGPYVQVMADLKKGVETCIPAEFNTPTRLDNYIVLGRTINTEFLQSETPAGLSEQCLASPVVVFGGSPHERSAVIQKVAVELLCKGEGGIAFDATGAWTALARAANGTANWQKVVIQVAGQDFWADPFALAKVTPQYTEALCDAFALVRDWTRDQREWLYQACYKTDESALELHAVIHVLEMLLAERSKSHGDPVLGGVQSLSLGRSALFFRSGSVNIPAATWAKSNKLVILDFSPLPEPQSSLARVAVYLYLAHLARNGIASTRAYYDDTELLMKTPRKAFDGSPVNLEQFARWFSLGNLPVVAGVGRPAAVPNSFIEIFDAAVCLQVRNKNDLKVIAAQMALDDRAEGGLYSEHRKSSYQVEFVQQMRPGWAILKRADSQEPFGITLSPLPLARESPVSPEDAKKASAPLAPAPGNEPSPPTESHAGETLVEHDLGTLSGFAGEVLDFLQASASAQDLNGAPVSQKLLADQLLYKLQPAFFRFRLTEKSGKDIRARLLDALAAADYLRTTYYKPPGGGKETGATVYEVTPKYLEALDDAKARGSAALQAKVAKITGTFAGQFAAPPPGDSELASPLDPNLAARVTPGKLEKAFVNSFLIHLAAARVALLNGDFPGAAKRAREAWARFIAQALNRAPGDVPGIDADSLARTLAAFPEWPFDEAETRVFWDEFRPAVWESLDNDAVDRKINELTSFHEQYQLRNADRGT